MDSQKLRTKGKQIHAMQNNVRTLGQLHQLSDHN